MRVTLFQNISAGPSMRTYADCLLASMPKNVKAVSVKGSLPFIKHHFHKEIAYGFFAKKQQGNVNHIIDHSYAGLINSLDCKKTIITCHDLIPLEFPRESSFFGKAIYWRNVKNLPKAARIIADSESTKKSIIKNLECDKGKIKVICPGVSENFKSLSNKERLKEKFGFGEKTILHAGSSAPRKNVELVLEMLKEDRELSLAKVGEFSQAQKKLILQNNLEERIMQFNDVSEKRLVEIYNASDVLVFPSIAEGFGLPILEAMACGCPVVCSKIGVFKELYSGAVSFVGTKNAQKAVSAVESIFSNERHKNKLKKSGIERAKQFSWKKTANETYSVYEAVFNET